MRRRVKGEMRGRMRRGRWRKCEDKGLGGVMEVTEDSREKREGEDEEG